jgi:hypothetical protein
MNLDKYEFYCPDCSHRLDENKEIRLKTLRENGDEGYIYLSTTLGDYTKRSEPNIEFGKGELIEFSCPHCNSQIHSKERDKFVHLVMRVENKFEFDILFSRVVGEQKTYLVTEDGVECYGKDCEAFL